MSWNFRVMEKDGEFAIYEVFYNDEGQVQGYTENPSFPRAESIEELKEDLERYAEAMSKPVLQYMD